MRRSTAWCGTGPSGLADVRKCRASSASCRMALGPRRICRESPSSSTKCAALAHTLCSLHRAAYDMQHKTTCSIQHTSCNILLGNHKCECNTRTHRPRLLAHAPTAASHRAAATTRARTRTHTLCPDEMGDRRSCGRTRRVEWSTTPSAAYSCTYRTRDAACGIVPGLAADMI